MGTIVALVGGAYWAYVASRPYLYLQGIAGWYTYDLLFSSASWALLAAVAAGAATGAAHSQHARGELLNGTVYRHDAATFFQHWGVVVSTLILLVTGILLGSVISPRLLSQANTVGFLMNLHFVATLLFLFAAFFHVAHYYLRSEERDIVLQGGDFGRGLATLGAMVHLAKAPQEAGNKYQASEKLAYLGWAVMIAGIMVSGGIKVAAHVWTGLPAGLMLVTTWAHDLFALGMLLLLIVHVAFVLLPDHRPLLGSMIHGRVSADFVRQHQPAWYRRITAGVAGSTGTAAAARAKGDRHE